MHALFPRHASNIKCIPFPKTLLRAVYPIKLHSEFHPYALKLHTKKYYDIYCFYTSSNLSYIIHAGYYIRHSMALCKKLSIESVLLLSFYFQMKEEEKQGIGKKYQDFSLNQAKSML